MGRSSKKKIVGVYKILNNINNKFYIGSSIDILNRKRQHFSELEKNRHGNRHLQSSYNKHGKENFEFIILEECDESILMNREQYYIDTFNPKFNIRIFAESNRGIVRSNDFRKKISQALKQRIIKDETREKISKLKTGVKLGPMSEEHKKKIGNSHRGKKITKEHKKVLSKLKKGKKLPPQTSEHKRAISDSMKNHFLKKKQNGPQ